MEARSLVRENIVTHPDLGMRMGPRTCGSDSFVCVTSLGQCGVHKLISSSMSVAPTMLREIPAAGGGDSSLGYGTRHLDLKPPSHHVISASSLTFRLVSSSGKWGQLLLPHKATLGGGANREMSCVPLTRKLPWTLCWKDVRHGFNLSA